MFNRALALLALLVLSAVPFAAYIGSLATNSWVSYDVLAGSQLRYEDDDGPEYIRDGTGEEPRLLVYNWTGLVEIGMWRYTLTPLNANGSYGDVVSQTISDCYQAPTTTVHHRACPTLILVRSFAVCAPILTLISLVCVLHIFRRQGFLTTPRWDAITFAVVPGLAGFVAWAIFRFTFGQNLEDASDFLPIYTVTLASRMHTMVGLSQAAFLAAWAMQVAIAVAFTVILCLPRPARGGFERLEGVNGS